jgi:hypothetical protein
VLQQNINNVTENSYFALPETKRPNYLCYAFLATKSINEDSQNSNTQTSSCGKHFQTAKQLKYGLDKQFKISQLTAAVAPCKINEGDYQQNTNKCGRLFILFSPGNKEHEKYF